MFIFFYLVAKTSKYFKTTRSNKSTLEQIPEFLPSENEESDEEEEEDTEGGVPTYVPPHLPSFPSKHSFRQTPVCIYILVCLYILISLAYFRYISKDQMIHKKCEN